MAASCSAGRPPRNFRVSTGADQHPQLVIPGAIFNLPAGPEERFSGMQTQRKRYGAGDEAAASGGTVFVQGLRQPHQEREHGLLAHGVAGVFYGNRLSQPDRRVPGQRQGDIGMAGIRRVLQRQHIAVPAAAGLVQQIQLSVRGDLRPQEVVFQHRCVVRLRQCLALRGLVHADAVSCGFRPVRRPALCSSRIPGELPCARNAAVSFARPQLKNRADSQNRTGCARAVSRYHMDWSRLRSGGSNASAMQRMPSAFG